MKQKITFFLVISFFFYCRVNAQVFTQGFNEQKLQLKVKQLDEFRQRFNLETDIEGKKIKSKNDIVLRNKYLISLFDEKIPKDTSKTFLFTVDNFINAVNKVDNPIYIKFEDSNWYAQAFCKIKL